MPNKAPPSPAFLPGATAHWTCGGRVIKVGELNFVLALLYWSAAFLVASTGQRAEAAVTQHLHLQPGR